MKLVHNNYEVAMLGGLHLGNTSYFSEVEVPKNRKGFLGLRCPGLW